MPYGNILIVDDVETNVYVAVGLMKLYKLQVDTATSGQEAIYKVKNGNVYDTIFMDHMMPEMDGIEATKHIRDLGYTAPIVALTANAVSGQADMFLQNGFDDFISKPIDIRQLDTILNKHIRDKQPPEIIEAARRQKTETTNSDNGNQIDPLLLESFIRDAKKTVAWLEEQSSEFTDEGVLRKFTVMVHGIKSSLWNVGEAPLAELALEMENCGRDKNIERIKTSIPEFVSSMRVLLEKLEAMQNEGNGNQEYSNENAEGICSKLLEIQKMCAGYNRKGALDLLAEIKHCSKETKAVLDNITGYILHSEFEAAESAAAAHADALAFENKETGSLR